MAGLPDEVRLITLGGGFVSAGQEVEAVSEGTLEEDEESVLPAATEVGAS